MPAFDPHEKAALLNRAGEGIRRIYCTEITSCDILPLLGGGEKLGGTLVDAILKKYQEVSEIEGRTVWTVLSSWLGQLVRVSHFDLFLCDIPFIDSRVGRRGR